MAMITYHAIMQIAEKDPNMKKTFEGVMHQVGCVAGGAAIGGVLGGPVGAVIGSLAGTAIGYWTVNDYNSVIVVLRNMNEADRRRFVEAVKNLVGSSAQDALLDFVRSEANRKQLIAVFQKFS